MRAGEKNKIITIEVATTTKNSVNEDISTWALYKVVNAKASDKAYDENFGSGQFTSQLFTIFKIDYIAGLSPKTHRIKYRNRTYDIIGFPEVGNNEAMEILTKAVY